MNICPNGHSKITTLKNTTTQLNTDKDITIFALLYCHECNRLYKLSSIGSEDLE